MPIVPISENRCRVERGSALVIVLFFVVLLSIVTIAFLSRSLIAIKVSAGSAGETKSHILATSASDIIIGDFRQEIIAGSTNFAGGSLPNSGTAAFPIYTPTANTTAIPFMNGVPIVSSTNAIPNMVSRSVSPANTSGSAPYVSYGSSYNSTYLPINRAANDPTATTYTSSKVNSATASLNGRYVSPAMWNEHFLIPRNAPGSSTDPTPASNFVPPDWVVVTRSGANSVTWTSGTGGLNDTTLSNNNCAIGRYAFAVYNEGGLLDMNAAGYPADPNPTTTTTPPFYSGTPNGLTPSQSGQKMGLPLADLTQLTVGTTTLTQAQVNNIVGWRNYASAAPPSPGGTFGSFTFTQANASNWLTNFVQGNTNGYMQIVPTPAGVTTPPTDQVFLSRQQLISVIQSLSINSDFLQYMGTFSRALEQPSTVPDPNRPLILTGAVPAQSSADSYLGNNDNQGKDTAFSTTSINPPFLSIRAASGFTRWNGTTAVNGEPLVKTKFALSWLRMVAYNAINTSLPSGFAATTADPDPIKDRFGLSRTSASSPWTYNHGFTNATTGGVAIGTLSQVAAAGREPDFAELLKAAIIAGSVGKGGPNFHSTGYNYQYMLDTVSDIQILQIMANLIDQQDTDSYPTVIQILDPSIGSGDYATVYGVEDLPYFYRYHLFSVVDKLPSPLLNKSQSVTFPAIPAGTTETGTTPYATTYPAGATATGNWTVSNSTATTVNYCAPGSLASQGEVTYLYVPSLWNPHDPNTTATETTALRPPKFRIFAATVDPVALTNPWIPVLESQFSGTAAVVPPNPNPTNIQAVSGFSTVIPETDPNNSATYFWPMANSGSGNAAVSYTVPAGGQGAATPANVTLTFSDANGTLFREPTLLWNTNPTGLNLSGAHISDASGTGGISPPQTYYGVIAGQSPISTQITLTSTPAQPTDGTYIVQGADVLGGTTVYPGLNLRQYLPGANGTSFPQMTFFLQYQDPNNANNWITYDVKYPDLHGMNAPTPIVNTADFPAYSYLNPLQNGRFSGTAACMDPRSARWGVGTQIPLGNNPGQAQAAYALEPVANANFFVNTQTGYQNMQSSLFTVFESNRSRVDPGDQVYYSNPCMTTDPQYPLPSSIGLRNVQMRWFGPGEYRAGSGVPSSPVDYDGLFSQNNPAIQSPTLAQNNSTTQELYNEDPDGVARPAMGAYASTNLVSGSTVGLPLATANTFNNNAVGTATSQSQSRALILNRPFRSVAEMSYAFRGSPWKNIDFFHPASGDSALLDTFCLTEPPPSAMVAGKVDLNTRQIPVLQAIVGGACVDEINNAAATPPSYALPPLAGGSSTSEAAAIATTLEQITSDTTHAWRGPLKNISGLVGRYVANPGTTSDTDLYTYSPPALASGGSLPSVSYAGLSSALDCSVWFGNTSGNHVFANAPTAGAQTSSPLIQRFRESALRPLAAAGQVRVWNLLIDVVAQTGHYPKTATGFDQFVVDGQTHLWVHVALDRYSGQVIDKQVEVVTQ